jgi:Uma2 family endonuclease
MSEAIPRGVAFLFEIKYLTLIKISNMGLVIRMINPMNDEEFYQFCRQNSDYRIERDRHGKIKVMEPTNSEAGNYNSEVSYEVTHWNRHTHLGKVFDSSTGFTLPNNAIKAPDVSWIADAKWQSLSMEERRKFAHIAPDFVIEIRSSVDDSLADLKDKMKEYIENGVRLGWLLDRIEGKAYVYRQDGSIAIFTDFETDVLSGEDVLPGFELKLTILL